MQKKGRGDMIPPTNSELKHQQALRAAQDPSLVRASIAHPADLAGESPCREQVMAPSQVGPSQDCTSQCAAKHPPAPQAPHGTPMAIAVVPHHRRQPASAPEGGQSATAATPTAAAAAGAPAAAAAQQAPLNAEAVQAHSRALHAMGSMPHADTGGGQVAQWAFPSAYPPPGAPERGGRTGSVYVVRALPDALPKAPAALPKTEAVAEQAPDIAQPGLVSSRLEREETSAPPPTAAAPRTRAKPLVDYASIYKFLASCFDLTHTWQGLLGGLTRMPNKERQLTVTLMGRMLTQMESRMQHTRGTAPPGWADLHTAAKLSGMSKGATVEVPQQAAAAPEAATAPEPVQPSACTPAQAAPMAPQPPRNGTWGARAPTQMHEVSLPAPAAAPDAPMQARMWPSPAGPGVGGDGDPVEADHPGPDTRQQRAPVDIGAAHHGPVQQCSPMCQVEATGLCDEPMADGPPGTFPLHSTANMAMAETRVNGRAVAAPASTPEQLGPQRQQRHGSPPSPAMTPASLPAGDVRGISFRSLIPTMHGPQSLAARAAFDARFDARMAGSLMHGPRMADVQVHGSRPAAQPMIPTPAIPPAARADETGDLKASGNGSSGAEDTGELMGAPATAADYLMGAVVPPALDSCMDVDGEEPLRPAPNIVGLQQASLMWMASAECAAEVVPHSAGHSATACGTDSAWTAIGAGSAEPPRPLQPYSWQQAWPGGLGPGMSDIQLRPGALLQQQQLQQQQQDEIGQLLMADDADDVALLGGPDMPVDMCMPHMHDEPMAQQPGIGAPGMSPGGGQGQLMQEAGGKPAGRFRAAGHEMAGAGQGSWLPERRQCQQRVPPWATGSPVV